MTDTTNPFAPDITDQEFARWFAQFSDDEAATIEPLLKAFRYYPSTLVASLCVNLFRLLPRPTEGRRRVYVPAGFVATGGSAIAYFFKTQNSLTADDFISLDDILGGVVSVSDLDMVMLDDYIGTGTNALALFGRLQAVHGADCRPTLALLTATTEGAERVADHTSFTLCVADPDPLPGGLAAAFPDADTRERALSTLERLGQRASSHWPLGYGKSAALVAFFYSTPDNTLPIFWSSENGWLPLFPRNTFGGSHVADETQDTKVPIVRPPDLDTYDDELSSLAENTIASRILIGEFQLLNVAAAVATTFSAIGVVETTTLDSLLRAINELKVHTHEKVPVLSNLLILSERAASPAIQIHARFGLHVADFDALRAWAITTWTSAWAS